jgi:hypothetical protein
MAMETSMSAPPMEDDGSDNLLDPNVQIQEDLQSLLDKKQTMLYDLQKKLETSKNKAVGEGLYLLQVDL